MKRHSRVGFAVVVLVSALAFTAAVPAGSPPTLADKVVRFCKAHLGRKVDNGECSALAWDALKAAGAQPRLYPDAPRKGDYVWGKQVYLLEAGPNGPTATGVLKKVKPGFVIQFRHVRLSDGTYPHHTAVVASVDVKTRTLGVYHQNVDDTQRVVEGNLRLTTLKNGWIRIYRPVPAKKIA
jgi:hypothetical protein